jgi:hypothetical protein
MPLRPPRSARARALKFDSVLQYGCRSTPATSSAATEGATLEQQQQQQRDTKCQQHSQRTRPRPSAARCFLLLHAQHWARARANACPHHASTHVTHTRTHAHTSYTGGRRALAHTTVRHLSANREQQIRTLRTPQSQQMCGSVDGVHRAALGGGVPAVVRLPVFRPVVTETLELGRRPPLATTSPKSASTHGKSRDAAATVSSP